MAEVGNLYGHSGVTKTYPEEDPGQPKKNFFELTKKPRKYNNKSLIKWQKTYTTLTNKWDQKFQHFKVTQK